MGVENLLPRRKEGWGELLILLVVVFAFHYIVFFSYLHHSYDLIAYDQDYDSEKFIGPISINASFPKYFADFDVGYIYVEIKYKSPNESLDNEVLWVYIYPVKCSNTYYDSDINFLSDSSIKDNSVMEILPLYPGETKSMRLPFYSAANIRGDDNITCTVKAVRVPSTVDDRVKIKDEDIVRLPSNYIQADRMAVLSLRVIGQLLLNSPWSNVLLITLVIVGRYFFSIYEDDKDKKKEFSICEFMFSMLSSLMGIALIGEIGLTVIYFPFREYIEKFSLVSILSLLIAFVSYARMENCKWYKWIRPCVLFFLGVELIAIYSSDEKVRPLFLVGAILGGIVILEVLPEVVEVVKKVVEVVKKRFLGMEIEDHFSDIGKESKDTQNQSSLESGKGEKASPSSNAEQGLKDARSSLKNGKDEEIVWSSETDQGRESNRTGNSDGGE